MLRVTPKNDWVHFYVSELTSRIVAESGIPTDRHHLGKIILQSLKDDPEFLLQIDGGTGQSETNGAALLRSIQCATCFRNMGLGPGDVMVLMAPNHLELGVPFYAALYVGVAIAPVDRTLGVYELQETFNTDKPKIIFCQSEKRQDIQKALDNIGLDAIVVTFDDGSEGISFNEMMEKHGSGMDVKDFKATDFDPAETLALLISTSGTTGLPKAAALTHKNLAISGPYVWCTSTDFPSPIRSALIVAPLQWLSSLLNYILGPYLKFHRVQSSLPATQEHTYELINKYKPAFMIISPTLMTSLLKPGDREKCDFTCFDRIYLAGSAVSQELIKELKDIAPETYVCDSYGMSELACFSHLGPDAPPGSCGQRLGCLQYKLVNIETEEEIFEPNVPGELWFKGPGVFKGYYNNPAATEEVFTKDGWLKSGDMFYRDESWNYYFVDRIKLLLKYRNHQISPVEVEGVIRQHPGVLDAAVAGIPDPECGDLCVACVVRRPGSDVTAQEIKDLVKETLTDSKQLRGGVIFVKELPQTASTKLHRRKLKEMVLTMERE